MAWLTRQMSLAQGARDDRERKANAQTWLDCSNGQPTFVTVPGGSDIDSGKGRLLRLSNISYSFNRIVLSPDQRFKKEFSHKRPVRIAAEVQRISRMPLERRFD